MNNTQFNNKDHPSAAYFSMEIGLESGMKTYAGGLGILAGDTLKSAADMGENIVGISILYKNGYFKQEIDESGDQLEQLDTWDYESFLKNTGKKCTINLAEGDVTIEIWVYDIAGVSGKVVPVYFLNTDLDENPESYRYASYNLYTPHEDTRLRQELILGIGGIESMKALGYDLFDNYHLNESHAAFGILALQENFGGREEAIKHTVFTTHTPAEHGHKKYYRNSLEVSIPDRFMQLLSEEFEGDKINLTKFSLRNSKFHNGVSQRHGQVSSAMFPEYNIDAITNGVHPKTWTANNTQKVFDKYIPGWQSNPNEFEKALSIPSNEIAKMHELNKVELINFINSTTDHAFSRDVFTIGFGRRVDMYKRSGFIFHNLEVLRHIADKFDGLQIVMSGKAYFNYEPSEKKIFEIVELSKKDLGNLKVVYLIDYSMDVSKLMIQGSDVWLNNPVKPLEASGTSGMKAAMNGVPSFSTIDGWWVEGWQEGITGWSIGTDSMENEDEEIQSYEIYSKLEYEILPTYYYNRPGWINIQKNCISRNGAQFNTHRMLEEYREKGYKS